VQQNSAIVAEHTLRHVEEFGIACILEGLESADIHDPIDGFVELFPACRRTSNERADEILASLYLLCPHWLRLNVMPITLTSYFRTASSSAPPQPHPTSCFFAEPRSADPVGYGAPNMLPHSDS
jgi:hypothetical protein